VSALPAQHTRNDGARMARAIRATGAIEGEVPIEDVVILIDPGADANIVDQRYALRAQLERVETPVPPIRWGEQRPHIFGAYKALIKLTDSIGQSREFYDIFYGIDSPSTPIILGMPGLKGQGVVIDTATSTWRYGIATVPLELLDKDEAAEVPCEHLAWSIMAVEWLTREDLEDEETEQRRQDDVVTLPEELREFEDVFQEDRADELPPHRETDHAIEITGTPPYGPLYNLSARELEELRRYLDDALAKEWIQHSTSPAGAPILFVPKKDKALRLCVDYRGLNKVTIKNRYPLPLISEILDRVSGAKWFTSLDIKNAYYRIRIREGDEWKTAFRTRYGHFEYRVMPFGLANAPASFQSYINQALAGLLDVLCIAYIDDILIYTAADSLDQHWRDVKLVLERLRKHGLYCNLKKCRIAKTKVNFLGYIISRDGVEMEPHRVDTIAKWPEPTSFGEVQTFLGFANFYRRFIHRYSHITAPMTNLLVGSVNGKKTGPFEWPDEAAQAFRSIRDAFTQAPLLVHYDPEAKTRIETDASQYAIAAILLQLCKDGLWHPVAFWSRKLIAAERNYETHDQELLPIVMAFRHWRHYVEGSKHPVEVVTDHNNLLGFMKMKHLNGRQARWAMTLASHDFSIVHRPGKKNPADAPSRRPDYAMSASKPEDMLPSLQEKLAQLPSEQVDSALSAWRLRNAPGTTNRRCEINHIANGSQRGSTDVLEPPRRLCSAGAASEEGNAHQCRDDSQTIPRLLAALSLEGEGAYTGEADVPALIKELQATDETAKKLRAEVEALADRNRQTKSLRWTVDADGLLRLRGRVYVPNEYSVKAELLSRYHDDPLAGHFGIKKTTALLERKYYWPDLRSDVKEYVESCEICQKTKAKRHRPYGELQSLPQPDGPWQELTMDFITDLPPSKRREGVYDAILVVMDRYTKMAIYQPTTKTATAADLADLFVEAVVSRFGTPKGIVSDRGSLFTSNFWSEVCYYAKVQRRLSTAFHPQTDGQTERQNQTLEHYLRTFCDERQSNWAKLLPLAEFVYNNSDQASIRSSPFYVLYGYNPQIRYDTTDLQRAKVPVAKDRVLEVTRARAALKTHWKHAAEAQAKYYNKNHIPIQFKTGSLVLLSTKNLRLDVASKKLAPKFIGPFRVLEPVGKQAYRLLLPSAYRIHNVFHVSRLEKFISRADNSTEHSFAPPELIDGEATWEIEEILQKKRNKDGIWYKVKWTGWPSEYNEWVPEASIAKAKRPINDTVTGE